MTRRLKRSRDYEVVLEVQEHFITPPRASQRNWLLNRQVKEFSDELEHCNTLAARMVTGCNPELTERGQGELDDDNVMEDWQIPIMKKMAEVVAAGQGDILEIGFGRGIASTFVQEHSPKSHTIVECNDSIVSRFQTWREGFPNRTIKLIHGMWQDRISDLETYDGILFHTYPLNEEEFVEQVARSVTFAEHFLESAAALLRPGGVLTYLTSEIDSISRAHQRLLFQHFSSFSLQLMQNLEIPEDTKDALWCDSTVVIQVVK